MSTDEPIENLLRIVPTLDREGCKTQLRRFQRPRLDFTDEFLDAMSVDRLRHLVMAACLQARRRRR